MIRQSDPLKLIRIFLSKSRGQGELFGVIFNKDRRGVILSLTTWRTATRNYIKNGIHTIIYPSSQHTYPHYHCCCDCFCWSSSWPRSLSWTPLGHFASRWCSIATFVEPCPRLQEPLRIQGLRGPCHPGSFTQPPISTATGTLFATPWCFRLASGSLQVVVVLFLRHVTLNRAHSLIVRRKRARQKTCHACPL